MLLTTTSTHTPGTDLGYLLHKNPAKLPSLDLSFEKAHVLYPKKRPRGVAQQRCYSMSIRWDWFAVSGDSMRVELSISR